MSRRALVSWTLAFVGTGLVAFGVAPARVRADEPGILRAVKDGLVVRARWDDGDPVNVKLPVQLGTTYRWDLVAAKTNGAKKLGRFFDDSEPPRFAYQVEKMTPEEEARFGRESGGLLGRVDGVQTIPLQLGSDDRVVLTFRKYDSLREGPPGEYLRVTLERLPR